MPTTTQPVPTPLGTLLRQWRDVRGRSQLALAMDMGVSQRHISFVESGRSVPSRALLLGMANALDVPLRDRNALLLAAGYFLHGIWDLAFGLWASSKLLPPHYDLFCLAIDFTMGLYLLLLKYKIGFFVK